MQNKQIDFLWKIGAPAGMGIMVSGLQMSKTISRMGYRIFNYIEYPSLVRGGHNTYEVRITSKQRFSRKRSIDCLVALNQDTYDFHKSRLTSNSLVIYDENQVQPDPKFQNISLPISDILSNIDAPKIMTNTVVLGASVALLSGDITILHQVISEQFSKKGTDSIKINQVCASVGYDYILKNYQKNIISILNSKSASKIKQMVMTGNEAFSLGAVASNCKLYVAYPMTPASSVQSTLASWQDQLGLVVRHSEDEISVINTALGSSFVGVRSAVGTSGGGFALMTESVSYAGIAEIPIVIFIAQRPGPATGMPTWTEQGDILFSVFAGHGDFPKIVIAPSNVQDMVTVTRKAFDLADIYQLPVLILSDKYLSESYASVDYNQIDSIVLNSIDRGKIISKVDHNYKRYQNTKDGVSPMLIPGQADIYYQANSYEHLEDSHTTEDAHERIDQVHKRMQKIQTYFKNDFEKPEVFGDLDKAKYVFVSFGSNKSIVLEAMERLKQQDNLDTAYIHFTYIYPLDKQQVLPIFKSEKDYILVENNSTGQFGKILQMQVGVEISKKILKYDGRPLWVEDILDFIKK